MPARFTWLASVTLCLALGFGLGWWMHPTLPPVVEPESHVLAKPEKSADEPADDGMQKATAAVDATAGSKSDGLTMAQRTAAIEWLKANGIPLGISPLGGLFHEDKLNPVFVRMFDLTPAEVGRLEGSLILAQNQNDAMNRTRATGGVNADGTQLSVQVVASPEEGGAIHDSLLSAFEQVLGPERFQLFNMVSRDGFERAFDSFGLGAASYIMNLQPKVASNGLKFYEVKRTVVHADGGGSISTSQLDLKTVAKEFPFLQRFIPPDLEQPAAK